jgi:hypothetical protein
MRHESDTHWFLKHQSGFILDLTAKQFETPPDYSLAIGSGFLTRKPSRRAREMIQKMLWQETETGKDRDHAGRKQRDTSAETDPVKSISANEKPDR